MGVYNLIPYINGEHRYDLSINCVPCKNINEVCEKATNFKKNVGASFVTIVKHITQI